MSCLCEPMTGCRDGCEGVSPVSFRGKQRERLCSPDKQVCTPLMPLLMDPFMVFLVFLAVSPVFTTGSEFAMTMPDVDPMVTKTPPRLCRAYHFNFSEPHFITHISLVTPHSEQHILFRVCQTLGYIAATGDATDGVFDCDDGTTSDPGSGLPKAPACRDQHYNPYIAFVPPDTGLAMPHGSGTPLPLSGYFVHYVHYHERSEYENSPGLTDNSTLILSLTPKSANPDMMNAGLISLTTTSGLVKGKSVTHAENACVLSSEKELGEVRVYEAYDHTHDSGRMSSLWKIDGQTKKWTIITRINSSNHEFRERVEHPDVILRKGDLMASRCTLNRTEDTDASISLRFGDEMCRLYVYYTATGNGLVDQECRNAGPPDYSWDMDERISFVPEYVRQMTSTLPSR